MNIISLLLLGVFVFVATTVSIKVLARSYARRSDGFYPIEPATACVLSAVVLISSCYYAYQRGVLLAAESLFLLMLAFVYIHIRLSGWAKDMAGLLLCGCSVLLLPADLPLFATMPAAMLYPILTVSMWLIIRLFSFLDNAPALSCITVMGQGFFLVMAAFSGLLPPEISISVFAVIIAVWASVLMMNAATGQMILGRYGSLVIGFFLGFVWTYFIAFGAAELPLVVFSTGIFQVIWASLATFVATRRFVPITEPVLFERALYTGIKPKGLFYYMLFTQILLSLLAFAIVGKRFVGHFSVIVIVGFVLVDLVVRLRRWGTPSPSFREVAGDLKTGLSTLFQDMKHIPLKSDKEKLSPKVKKTGKKRKK